jgi:hypothetical protein
MKASFFPLLCLVGSTLAAPVKLVSRDTEIITSSIQNIKTSTQALAAEVRSLDTHRQGTSFDSHVALIKHHGEELSRVVRGAADIIKNRAPPVTIFEATSLYLPVQQMADATATATKAWIYQKNTIVRSGGKNVVINILENLRSSADLFAKAMVSKMPMGVNWVGEIYGNVVQRSITEALDAFKRS